MSCGGSLSPVMAIAGSGVLQNVGLGPAAALTTAISGFTGVPAVGQFTNIIGAAAGSALSGGVFSQLATLGANVFPALTNVIPGDLASSALSVLAPGGISNSGLTGLISSTATGLMGDGDLSRFTQIFNSATGFASQASAFVSSALNTDALSNTFGAVTGGMNNLITGGFNQVSSAFPALGGDLARLGNLVDLGNLPNLGDPAALLRQVAQVAGSELPALEQALQTAGISGVDLNSLTAGINEFGPSVQRDLYQAFTQVTGDQLAQVKSVLGVTTPGITNMAQLLDPKSILPNSFGTLNMPTPDGITQIYTASGSVNTALERFLVDPNAPEYTGDDPIVRARLGLPPLPSLPTDPRSLPQGGAIIGVIT